MCPFFFCYSICDPPSVELLSLELRSLLPVHGAIVHHQRIRKDVRLLAEGLRLRGVDFREMRLHRPPFGVRPRLLAHTRSRDSVEDDHYTW